MRVEMDEKAKKMLTESGVLGRDRRRPGLNPTRIIDIDHLY